jgi:hypothetical protein
MEPQNTRNTRSFQIIQALRAIFRRGLTSISPVSVGVFGAFRGAFCPVY